MAALFGREMFPRFHGGDNFNLRGAAFRQPCNGMWMQPNVRVRFQAHTKITRKYTEANPVGDDPEPVYEMSGKT